MNRSSGHVCNSIKGLIPAVSHLHFLTDWNKNHLHLDCQNFRDINFLEKHLKCLRKIIVLFISWGIFMVPLKAN